MAPGDSLITLSNIENFGDLENDAVGAFFFTTFNPSSDSYAPGPGALP